MSPQFCITFRFLQPFPLFHGSADGGSSEWPPSPMRAFQALLNAASLLTRGQPVTPDVQRALLALEVLEPEIVAPRARHSEAGYRAYVPHNHADLLTPAWHRGDLDASIASHRTEKDIRPMRIESDGDELPELHYLYPLQGTGLDPGSLLETLRPSVRAITHLGWGIDQTIADATLVEHGSGLSGERWFPSAQGSVRLRVHRKGSLESLQDRHRQFLNRLRGGAWTPVPPLTAFNKLGYRRTSDPLARPHAIFKLLDEGDDPVAYPHAKLVHVAGMTRHLAIQRLKARPPRNLHGRTHEEWLEHYVAGHISQEHAACPHAQFSYVPLPSIGHHHADPGVRRIMVVSPAGDGDWLEHLADLLDGQVLKPLVDADLKTTTRLHRISENSRDGVRDAYTKPSAHWASFTPVILPGHDDLKEGKTRKLILKALAQSGIDLACEFEWSKFSSFPKSYGAHAPRRMDSPRKGNQPPGYIRPGHLLRYTAVHLRIKFEQPVLGPLIIGSGRHCGFGLMATLPKD